MEQYKNLGGNSNIRAFSIGNDYVDVVFNGENPIDIHIEALAWQKLNR